MEKFQYVWISLVQAGFYPWITIGGCGIYFTMRFVFDMPKPEAIKWVFLVALLGQAYFDFPTSVTFSDAIHDILGTFFFIGIHVVICIGIYSFFESIKIIELLQVGVKSKIEALIASWGGAK